MKIKNSTLKIDDNSITAADKINYGGLKHCNRNAFINVKNTLKKKFLKINVIEKRKFYIVLNY